MATPLLCTRMLCMIMNWAKRGSSGRRQGLLGRDDKKKRGRSSQRINTLVLVHSVLNRKNTPLHVFSVCLPVVHLFISLHAKYKKRDVRMNHVRCRQCSCGAHTSTPYRSIPAFYDPSNIFSFFATHPDVQHPLAHQASTPNQRTALHQDIHNVPNEHHLHDQPHNKSAVLPFAGRTRQDVSGWEEGWESV